MTETRLAETDASRYATRRARRAAERQHELAALAENQQGPAPISGPVPVAEMPQPAAEATTAIDPAEPFAGLLELAAEAAPVVPRVAIEPPVVDLTAASPIDVGELVAELAGHETAVDAPQDEPRHRPRARKHRAAPQPKPLRAPSAKAAPRTARRRRSPGRIVLSGLAALSAAGLAIAVAVPAATFGTPVQTTSAPAAAPVSSTAAGGVVGQSVDVGGTSITAGAATADRGDNFSAQTYADVIRAQYAGQVYHATFVPTAGAIRWPFSYPVAVSAPYGYSSQYAFGWHDGVDFIPGYGAPASAIASGVVIWVGDDGALGYSVRIQHNVGGHTVVSIYGHMISGSSQLYPGETVKVGDQVGLTGQTGQATGPHLHLGLSVDGELTDPYVWLTLNATNVK